MEGNGIKLLSYISIKDSGKFSKVVNCRELSGVLHVRLDGGVLWSEVYEIMDMTENPVQTVSLDGVEYYSNHRWIDVPWENLDRTNGFHVYRIAFMQDERHYTYRLFSYTVQDDYPERDYIYMSDRYLEYDEDKQGSYITA